MMCGMPVLIFFAISAPSGVACTGCIQCLPGFANLFLNNPFKIIAEEKHGASKKRFRRQEEKSFEKKHRKEKIRGIW